MTYPGSSPTVARYECSGAAHTHGVERGLSFGGLKIDQAIDGEIRRVLAPGAIEAACAGEARTTEAAAAARRALEFERQAARYEAERARRQYDAVEPENRLVAGTLERRWNAALAGVHALEARVAAHAAEGERHRGPDRATLMALAEAFPRVWAEAASESRTKKRIVRLLVEEMIATAVAAPSPQIELIIHWKGGKHTRLVIARNRSGQHRRGTDRAIVDVARDLARSLPDREIARVLNRLGYRTGAGNSWTQLRVTGLRSHHDIPVFTPAPEGPKLLTLGEAAKRLGVNKPAVRRLITLGLLPATQPVLYAPWAIRPEDLETEAMQRATTALRRGETLPRTPAANQLTFENSTT
ncbi:MAG: helix-turn-helix domain-containing protein [Candidatus Rokuibacteriota bacterium]